jgi:dTDP-4-amino-4,6-dideoxygalactose transaminase
MPIEVYEKEFGMNRDELYEKLKQYNVFTRRYFYPLVCDFACYKSLSIDDSLTQARRLSNCILTLPTYYDLSLDDVNRICDILVQINKGNKS